mgnify:FL=1|jgi:hypothetical protein
MSTPAYVPIEDVSKHFSVSISTVRGWIRRNHIPSSTYIKVGNTYRFSIPDVVTALSSVEEKLDEAPTDFDLDPDEDL